MQGVLAPIYLLGAFATGAAPAASWVLPFLAVHVGLYGGATAYNSYYDRDTGPIAFRKHPLPVTRREMQAALALELAAIIVLFGVSRSAGAIAAIMLAMGIAYSFPRWRWKRSAVRSTAAVALGQGAGAFCLGYASAAGALAGGALGAGRLAAAALATAITTAGLYPITQVYQVDEDRRRGDDTLPARLGWRRALVLAIFLVTVGSWMLAAVFARATAAPWVIALVLAPGALGVIAAVWVRRFETQGVERRHDWAMGTAIAASLFFLAFAWLGLGH